MNLRINLNTTLTSILAKCSGSFQKHALEGAGERGDWLDSENFNLVKGR